jgi:TPR repeat protein
VKPGPHLVQFRAPRTIRRIGVLSVVPEGIGQVRRSGVPQDYAAAMSWYRKAADQGNAPAQFNLGFMYFNGLGVPQDDAAAASWYRKAADQGDTAAQFSLGVMYLQGEGVPQDYVSARLWFNLAAAANPISAGL